MSTQEENERLKLLQGTLDLLILRTLVLGSLHGQGIARAIQHTSENTLLVEHGASIPRYRDSKKKVSSPPSGELPRTTEKRVSIRSLKRAGINL